MNHGSACLRSPCAVTKSLKWAPSLIHKTLKSPWVKLRETLLSRPLRGYASSSVLLGQALWNSKTNEFIKSDANSKRITDNSSSNSRVKRRINRKIKSDELSVKLTIIPLSNCFLVSYVRAQLRKKAKKTCSHSGTTFSLYGDPSTWPESSRGSFWRLLFLCLSCPRAYETWKQCQWIMETVTC